MDKTGGNKSESPGKTGNKDKAEDEDKYGRNGALNAGVKDRKSGGGGGAQEEMYKQNLGRSTLTFSSSSSKSSEELMNNQIFIKTTNYENLRDDMENKSSSSGEQAMNWASDAAAAKPRKLPFAINDSENGNLISVHHTIQEDMKILRIPLTACGFNDRGSALQLVSIDRRGNIFVFDFLEKVYWHLTILVPKAKVVVPTKHKPNEFLIGTKTGELFLVNVETSIVLHAVRVSPCEIESVSFPGQDVKPGNLALIMAGHEAIIINLDTFVATHRLEFNESRISLKYASYLPYSDQIFTCFTNDAIHLWSSVSLNTLNVTYPIKIMHRKLKQMADSSSIPTFKFQCAQTDPFHPTPASGTHDFSNGVISAYCLTTHNGGIVCLATLEKYLILLQLHTFEFQQAFRLQDFVVKQCEFIVQPKELLLAALIDTGHVLILDLKTTEYKLVVQVQGKRISLSPDSKVLAIASNQGELTVWSTNCLYNALKSQQQCMTMLKEGFKQTKSVEIGITNEYFNEDIKKLLKRDRLLCILREYGSYPVKYRNLIWCSLLELPCNRGKFQQLLKLKTPAIVAERVSKLKLKDDNAKRSLLKIWSCLAHWGKVFAYSEFLPTLLFPFIKLFPRNALVTFEICATLLLNHFQLWFEHHPMEPEDYLGMCTNVLQYFDPELCKFYKAYKITAKDYAWSILSNAFSEILDEEQWQILWDNILSCPLYAPIFVVVAYNMLQRDVIMLLPDKDTIQYFFHEQNPLDIALLIERAYKLMYKCPAQVHPERYLEQFQPLPKNVYPKFLRYPREWIERQETEAERLKQERETIEARIREVEMEETKVLERLTNKLKAEEHAKRIKEMERLYQDTIKREEERVACHRKLLLLYQKEARNRKSEILASIRQSELRKQSFEMEKDMDVLLHNIERERERNDVDLVLAEDQLRDKDMELLEAQFYLNSNAEQPSLSEKYKESIEKLHRDHMAIRQGALEIVKPKRDHNRLAIAAKATEVQSKICHSNLGTLESALEEIEREFLDLTQKK